MTSAEGLASWQALPEAPLRAPGPLTRSCLDRGIPSLRELGRRLCELPYGRGADRADWAGVFRTGSGTCSSKHALLAATAAENDLPLKLCLGLYEMDDRNTPGVGPALEAAGLPSVLEAHCYVRWEDTRIDITRAGIHPAEPIRFLAEETIAPDQIGAFKVAWHRDHLARWCRERGYPDPAAVWKAREACIQALAGAPR